MARTDSQVLHPVHVRQLAALSNRSLDDLMDNYLPDAALLRYDGVWAGTAALRELFTGYLSLEPTLIGFTEYVQTDDTVFYRAVMRLGGVATNTFGTLVVKHGKIWRQTAGFLSGS
ncbi:nuclear transport factor 2 family protein [Streptacidiphilus sp. EB129]|uniref:nuclear transport factor 2 family protein n=1 Tax=Streptacidiphilus sp. EB129 TaxID=3156262 RepID=UPI0035182A35